VIHNISQGNEEILAVFVEQGFVSEVDEVVTYEAPEVFQLGLFNELFDGIELTVQNWSFDTPEFPLETHDKLRSLVETLRRLHTNLQDPMNEIHMLNTVMIKRK